jgi:PAS domain S-box-containing protein
MNVFAASSLLTCAVSAFFGTFVLYRNPKEASNRIFFLYCLTGAYWAFAEFGYRQAESLVMASFWFRAGFLATLAVPLELHFIMCLTQKTELLEKKSTYLVMYGPALAYSFLEVAGLTASRPVEVYWGWTYIPGDYGILSDLFDFWFFAISLSTLIFCWQYHQRAMERRKKRQIGLVTMGVSVLIILALFTEPDGVLDALDIKVPELTSVGFTIECVLLAYAIRKYELFPLTPATAAESIIATLTDALFLVTPQGKIATANQATLDLLGYTQDDLTGQPVHTILAPAAGDNFERTHLPQLLAAGTLYDAETIFVTQDAHHYIPISLSASVMRDQQDGDQLGTVYVARDLTERKHVEEHIRASLREKETLLKEIHHRVKNNLQVIISLLMLQSGYARDRQVLETLRESQNRIHSMAVIHEILYQSQDLAQVDLAAYVHKLAAHLLHSYDADSHAVALKINVAPVSLSVDTAIACGLIINELVSNSLKYAFPNGRGGEIRINLQTGERHQLTLTVSDDGVGLSPQLDPSRTETLGLQLVTMLTQQLEGFLELDHNAGTTFKIVFNHHSAVHDTQNNSNIIVSNGGPHEC